MTIKIKAEKGAQLPSYQTPGAAGADIRAFLNTDIVLKSGERTLVPTGLYFEIPEGYEVQIRPRSGLAVKNGITLLNTPGTIDSDYRGEIKIIMINLGTEDFVIKNGDRIAQMVVCPVIQAVFETTEDLSVTERGDGGFGHTGVKN